MIIGFSLHHALIWPSRADMDALKLLDLHRLPLETGAVEFESSVSIGFVSQLFLTRPRRTRQKDSDSPPPFLSVSKSGGFFV
jgi:hypothetical protein